MEDGHRESQFLLPAQRKIFHHGVAFFAEVQSFEQCIRFFSNFLVAESIDAPEEADILPHLEIFIQREFLAHVSDVAFDPFIFLDDIIAGHGSCPCRGHADATKHLHGCGFSCPVGTEEPENLTLIHVESNVIYGGKIAELFRQV